MDEPMTAVASAGARDKLVEPGRKIMNAKTRRSILLALALGALAAPAQAQSDYPNKPIRIIVGFAAGGGNDIFARLVGAKLAALIGQNVIIENRPGAGARLGNEIPANQP